MKRIINLTQHEATPEQVAQGVVDLPQQAAGYLRHLLTFAHKPAEPWLYVYGQLEVPRDEAYIMLEEFNDTGRWPDDADFSPQALIEAMEESEQYRLPSREEIAARAEIIANLCLEEGEEDNGAPPTHAMIGGAPFLMPFLHQELEALAIRPLYAFSERVSIEEHQPDGTVQKVNEFKHLGFV